MERWKLTLSLAGNARIHSVDATNDTKNIFCCVQKHLIAITPAIMGYRYIYSVFLFVFCIYAYFSGSLCAAVPDGTGGTPTPPGVQGVAEKGVGVKRQPIGLYTHPHSLPFDTQGVAEKRVPYWKQVPCSENKKKGGEFGWRIKRQQKAEPMT